MASRNVLIFSIALVLSMILTGIMRAYARRANLVDVPNQRSSHRIPTARGGGLAIVLVVLGGLSWLFVTGVVPYPSYLSLFVGGVLVAGIGFVDDHGHVSAVSRFLVQMTAATFAVAILGGLPDIQLGGAFVDLGLAGNALAVVFVVWMTNLYNFMDGVDGIAAVEALCIAGSVLLISTADDGGYFASLVLIFAAATFGFLVWNWPPAKVFMGDVGSGFIGFVLAVFAIMSSLQGDLSIWCWLILSGVFVVDATITLVTRVINGEQWYAAHNSHAYQKASRRLRGHRPVTLAVLVINLCWLLPNAWLAWTRPEFGWWLTLLAWMPLVALVVILKAGQPDMAES